ncbi:hypothetical protein L7F22_056878 [Adiantum nelumboides]|nr:hypothetical protein [Adiantum nelumboides]
MLSDDEFDEPDEPPEPDEVCDDNDEGDGNDKGDDMVLDDSTDEEDFVEFDPSGRYGRYSEVLGKGAMKKVYRAYDMTDCKEVAWNKARPPIECSEEQAVAVQREIHILQGLHHQGIIKVYYSWVDDNNGDTNFITELCSTTLLDYRLKHKHISRKAVKIWGQQILKGLAHLHMQNPPIIHRDLKCENILVKCRSDTALKIGDFGSATFLDETHHMHTLVGTPEFMAPEMFQEDYNELVDVYSFGMCMLELLTRECPYSECKSLGQIYKKVTSGEKPMALHKVTDMQALRLINRCLLPACKRPSANELLADPFLQCHEGQTGSGQSMKASTSMPNLRASATNIGVKNMLSRQGVISRLARSSVGTKSGDYLETVDHNMLTTKTKDYMPRKAICTKSPSFRRSYRVTGRVEDQYTLRLKIRIQESSRSCDIDFPFDLRFDSPKSVADEMVRTLDYSESDLATITDLIREEIAALLPSMEEISISQSPDMRLQGSLSKPELKLADSVLSSISSATWELGCKAGEIKYEGPSERLLSYENHEMAEEELLRKAPDDSNRTEFSASFEDGGSMTTVFTYEVDSCIDDSSDSVEFNSENEELDDSRPPENESPAERDTNSLSCTSLTEQASSATDLNECNSSQNNIYVALNNATSDGSDCAFRRKNRLVLFGSRQSPPHGTSESSSRFKQPPAGIGILLRTSSEQGLRRARPSCINAFA